MKKILKITGLFGLSFLAFFAHGQEKQSTFDRDSFYKAMQINKIDFVNDVLNRIKEAAISGKEAFEGALTMKKAGLSNGASKKLKIFKSGHQKLEKAIQKDPSNVEYRFLRLMVQENAPKALGYKNELDKDSEVVRKGYKTLPEPVKQAVIDYNKKSKVLKLQDS